MDRVQEMISASSVFGLQRDNAVFLLPLPSGERVGVRGKAVCSRHQFPLTLPSPPRGEGTACGIGHLKINSRDPQGNASAREPLRVAAKLSRRTFLAGMSSLCVAVPALTANADAEKALISITLDLEMSR